MEIAKRKRIEALAKGANGPQKRCGRFNERTSDIFYESESKYLADC